MELVAVHIPDADRSVLGRTGDRLIVGRNCNISDTDRISLQLIQQFGCLGVPDFNFRISAGGDKMLFI